ncbi:MAG TPA: glycosyltransferase family 4 protein, partial [Methanomassiliicoccales archaeon]|nr:glycosyltransferase family 4 protein [Methanomassiliicoccales archaeon]
YASELNDRMFLRHLDKFDRVVCVSDYMKKDVAARGFSEDRLQTIYNGVEIPEAPCRDGDYLLSLGRLVRLKGLDALIRAMQNTKCQLRICGEGPERRDLERLSQRLGLTDRIDFMGWISEEEKHRMLCECRMFVIPSVHEAYGMVAAEAMSYGKPVIASNTGGLPEVVGDAGMLIPPQDEKALAEAISSLDGDAEKRLAMGTAARERMKAFSWDEMARRTGVLYSELVSVR